VTKIKNIRKPC